MTLLHLGAILADPERRAEILAHRSATAATQSTDVPEPAAGSGFGAAQGRRLSVPVGLPLNSQPASPTSHRDALTA